MKIAWSQLVKEVEGTELCHHSEVMITRLGYDSRLISLWEGLLFVALKSARADGHDFIPELYARGVRCFVVERPIEVKAYPEANIFLTPSSRACLQDLGRWAVAHHPIPLIAITGSNAKTLVKEWLATLLSEKFVVAKSPRSFNSQIGVPLSVWDLSAHHQIGIFEAGISQQGEMEHLEKILQPSIGIFTNIGEAHDQGFKDLANKIAEKAKLFVGTQQIICRRDHAEVFDYLKGLYPNRIFDWSTTDPQACFYYALSKNSVSLQYQGAWYVFQFPFSFEIWIENALHALTAALLCGLDQATLQQGLDKLKPLEMRLEIKKGIDNCYLIDDTYNNDFQGLTVALDFLKQQKQRQNKTVILTDIQQSGLTDAHLYKKVNELLVSQKINRLFTIGKQIAVFQDQFEIPVISYLTVADFLSNQPNFQDEMILVKGARKFALERIIHRLEAKKHRTQLEIRLEGIVQNLNQYKQRLSEKTKIMVMVKAFGYGGGSLEIANVLQFHHIDYLGVAYLDEAIALRKNGIETPIMVMNPDLDQLEIFCDYQLEPEIYNMAGLKQVMSLASKPKIHLKIDTGMHRLGFDPSEVNEIKGLLSEGAVEVAGIFTHFSMADLPLEDDFTHNQVRIFEQSYGALTMGGSHQPLKYACNSSAMVRFPEYQFDMVRLGIGLYGFDPSGSMNLAPVSVLKTRISQIKTVKKGEYIGYGTDGRADRNATIAIVPIGYADGYARVFGKGRGFMGLHDHQVPTIGNICMDMTMLDVTGISCFEGDTVVVFGEKPTIEDLAEWAQTIPYEILTSVSQRVSRIFIG
jgi:alanine racemase